MYYIYVFDYSLSHIYEIVIDEDELPKINDKYIELYLYKHYHLKADHIDYMTVDHKLEIERIEKVK